MAVYGLFIAIIMAYRDTWAIKWAASREKGETFASLSLILAEGDSLNPHGKQLRHLHF